MACGAEMILMEIVEDETNLVAGFEFGVPRYRTTPRFPQTR